MRPMPAVAVTGFLLTVMMQPAQAASDCTTIGKPLPSVNYIYERAESGGARSRYTNRWESLTDKGSRVRTTTESGGTSIQVNAHHIVGDVMVLDRSTRVSANGGVIDSTAFFPGIVGDPAFRACIGRSWVIRPVTANYQSGSNKASSATPAGTLRIVAVGEVITVPAGKFETIHYIRTSASTDEYWKSIDHGVVVKHIATLAGATVSEVLVSNK